MTKNLNNHYKELKNAVAEVPLKEKNTAQEKSGAMLKNIQKRCKKYVMPIRVKRSVNYIYFLTSVPIKKKIYQFHSSIKNLNNLDN